MSEWNKLIPKPKSSFLRVRCRKCNNEQDMFGSPVNKVTCNVCGAVLAEPSGGKAKLKDSDVQAVLE
jgi:small subunit ribosomal protein S27e